MSPGEDHAPARGVRDVVFGCRLGLPYWCMGGERFEGRPARVKPETGQMCQMYGSTACEAGLSILK